MPRQGDTIHNPTTGERMTFRQTARETAGQLLQVDFVLQPNGAVPVEHVHPQREERFQLHAGTLMVRVAGVEHLAHPGDEVVIPPGTPHRVWNPNGQEAHAVVEFRPAGRMDEFFDKMFELGRLGKTDAAGKPNLLQTAVVVLPHLHECALAGPPLFAQRLLFTMLAPIARLLGYRSRWSDPIDNQLYNAPGDL
ncbi:MAG TPA: cupin domain-containing protein [Chloroflexota bacterium]|nr:cupin domain-containing protein [Chloroflexota bacterium]